MKPINYHGNYMVLELTNKCNCNCVHCIRDKGLPYLDTQGFVKRQIVEKLIDDLVELKLKFYDFNMFWLGEPLMHPEFASIYSYVLKANQQHRLFGSINIHTNAHLLTKQIGETLNKFSDVPQTWHLTIDAATPGTYKQIKRVGGYRMVVNNAKHLLQQKRGKFPRIVFQFIVEEGNYHEVQEFIRFWSDELRKNQLSHSLVGYFVPGYVDNFIFLRQCDAVTGGAERQEKLNALYKRVLKENNVADHDYSGKQPLFNPEGYVKIPYLRRKKLERVNFKENTICSGFWKTPTISWTGEVTVCQRDSSMELKVGDLNEHSFSEIWWENNTMREYRQAMINQDFRKIPLCDKCLVPKSSNYSAISIEELEYYMKNAK